MTKPARRQPRQARAKFTVDAILAAAAHCLIEHGIDRLSTTRVAERAGVSIGSLYQYFADGEALCLAVLRRYTDEFVAAFTEKVFARDFASLDDAVDALVAATLIDPPQDPAIHHLLIQLERRFSSTQVSASVGAQIVRLVETLLAKHQHHLPPQLDLHEAATIVVATLEGFSHRSMEAHPVMLQGEDAARHGKRLILGYLLPSPPVRNVRPRAKLAQ